MDKIAKKLIRTVGIAAAKSSFTFFSCYLTAAGGANIGYAVGNGIFRMRNN